MTAHLKSIFLHSEISVLFKYKQLHHSLLGPARRAKLKVILWCWQTIVVEQNLHMNCQKIVLLLQCIAHQIGSILHN